jgi:hypothetical protein
MGMVSVSKEPALTVIDDPQAYPKTFSLRMSSMAMVLEMTARQGEEDRW